MLIVQQHDVQILGVDRLAQIIELHLDHLALNPVFIASRNLNEVVLAYEQPPLTQPRDQMWKSCPRGGVAEMPGVLRL